jgi:pimeloyl-ACP methyl ester carboxylesterase
MNRKKILLISVCVFCAVLAFGFFGIASRVYAETTVDGDIVADTVWTKDGSPYVINAPITIATGTTLSIETGVEIRLTGKFTNLRVLGTLSARGSADDNVVFSSSGPEIPSVNTFGGSMYLRHVQVSGIRALYAGDQGRIVLDRATLVGTGVGIYGSSFEAVNSSFLNAAGTAINVFEDNGASSTALIRNSTISGAKSYGLYVGPGTQVDARHNFWGDASGPNNFQYNKMGKGNKVYGTFNLEPWLTADPFACCSSVLFLPGLEASRLYAEDGNRLWEPNRDRDVELLRLTASGTSANQVHAKVNDVIDEAYAPIAGPNIYKSFIFDMNALVATGTIRDWAPMAYDWRLSLDQLLEKGTVSPVAASSSTSSIRSISYLDSTSTPYIIQEFDRLARESKTGRVSIVAHSNGGLVAKALALRLEARGDESLIDKMVFVAVPQTGTPHAIGALLHGFKEGIPLLASAPAMRHLGQNMPSAYNLLPSARYLAFDSRPLITFSATTSSSSLRDLFGAYGSVANSFSELLDFLRGSEGRKAPAYADLSLPEKLNEGLLSASSIAHDALDAWTPSPSSELFQIAGKGIDTVSGLEYYEGRKGKKPILLYRPRLIPDGDGTVVSQSAWAIPDGPNVSKYWVDLRAASRGLSRNRAHADILEVRDLRDFITEILSELPHAIRHRAQVASAAVIPPKDSLKRIRIFVHSPDASVGATDVRGNHTGVSPSTGLVETAIPDSEYREFGDVAYVCVPEGRVTISPAPVVPDESGSVTIDIDEVIGDEVTTSSTYGDISVGTSSVIMISIAATTTDSGATSTVPVVGIDDEGDGIFDREILPDVPGAGDEPPAIVPDAASETEAGAIVATLVSDGGSRSGGRRRDLLPALSVSSAPSSTEPFNTATTGLFMAARILDSEPVISEPVSASPSDTTIISASSSMPLPASTSSSGPHLAAAYAAGDGIARLSPRLPARLFSMLWLVLALLIALAILWFLSCKISKSR